MKRRLALTQMGRAVILYSGQEDKAVLRSIRQLETDIQKVTGCPYVHCTEMTEEPEEPLVPEDPEIWECVQYKEDETGQRDTALYIVAGTIGKNSWIDRRICQDILKVDAILDDNNRYHWEGYVIQEVDGILYIAGADRRGTIYGIYEFSRWMGVSPWYFFGDVPVRQREISIPAGFYRADYPSVQYRGIFINDEEELEAWAKKHTADKTIGPQLYEKIFELLLRLKANYIWPAMHVNYFNENPRNGELAEEMGIVVGTSHCDMLLRSNQNEWGPWTEAKGYKDVRYDYSIGGENQERLREYWRESLEMNRDYENTYTIGMRGIHDYGFVTKEIDERAEWDEEQKQEEKIKLMQQIFLDQQEIMKEILGEEKARNAVKVFIPYKEVLDLYDGGLEVPEDVTLMWVDDNFGHMRRYPSKAEAARKGGCGLYFHNSYWAHPEMSYLFINSIPLAQTGHELEKSYEKGIRKIWVLNVGAIKPLEMDIEFFILYGWEAGKEKTLTGQPDRFVQEWVNSNFSGDMGREAADLYAKYARLTNMRKVEHMVSDVFAQEGYGDEAGRRLAGLKELFDKGNEQLRSLPEDERDAYFELFLMKIHASFWINAEYYFADRSRLSFQRGLGKAADQYMEYSRIMMDHRRQMLYFYNTIMCDGKWDAILTPEDFPPPRLPLYPAGRPALVIKKAPCISVITWDGTRIASEGEMVFCHSGVQEKWIEIGNMGGGTLKFTIHGYEDTWITLSSTEGMVQTEERISLCALEEWGDRRDEIILVIEEMDTGERKRLIIRWKGEEEWENDFSGVTEADGGVTMLASKYNRAENIRVIPGLGRTWGDMVMAMPQKDKKAVTEYEFYTFSPGDYEMELQRYVTLNSKGQIRLEVQLDDREPVWLESLITDEWRGGWKDSILDNGEKLYCTWKDQRAGRHTLTITIPDEYVAIDRITVYTAPKKRNNLGIPCSQEMCMVSKDMLQINWEELARQAEELYQARPEEIPLPEQVYASKDFWKVDRLYAPNETYPQKKRGKKRSYLPTATEEKNVLQELEKMELRERNGRLGIEAECVLAENGKAWRSDSQDGLCRWEHLQAETAGRTGIAMQAEPAWICYKDPLDAPGLHYKIMIQEKGTYHVWLLMYVSDDRSDLLVLALDGRIQPLGEQYSHGGHFTYGTSHIYYWNLLSDLELSEGEHVLSILPLKTGFRVDRIYLTMEDELPPDDDGWDGGWR